MKDPLPKYITQFTKLRIDKAHETAPHKPVLLISVLQAFQNKVITTSRIYITPELVALFKTNWSLLVTSRHDCRFALPFFHMKSEGFWKLIPKPGFKNILLLTSAMRSFTNLNSAIDYAEIDEDLTVLLKDKTSNNILNRFLIDTYFLDYTGDLTASTTGQQRLFNELEGKILNESPETYKKEIAHLLKEKDDEELFIRGSLFKREIPKIYNNSCCISGMRIDASVDVSMIDACHIIPFSESYNDTITNGIALCPNLHRAFDRGLISIDSNYRVAVSDSFKEDRSNYSIRFYAGKQIQLPKLDTHFPLKENLQWHFLNIFKK